MSATSLLVSGKSGTEMPPPTQAISGMSAIEEISAPATQTAACR